MAGIPGIIYPPTLDFNYLVQRPQQLLKAVSQLGVTIYFLNRCAHRQGKFKGIEKYNEHFYLFHQEEPSYPGNVRPVVYYSNPTQVETIGSYNHSLLVFDSLDEAADEFSSWKPYYHRAVASADLVLAASDKLYLQAREINPHTVLLPNGCDYDHFKRVRMEQLAKPHDLPELKAAVIGYIGAVASWCDLELLDRLALAFPDCSLLIIGPLYNVHNIPLRSNIHWLGYKDYDELIYYASCFNVGIIPFKTSAMTQAVNPIKMWEYMAMGIPVVTTALPEAGKCGDIVYYSTGWEDFINHVRQALKNENWKRCEQRMVIARKNSWMARARQMLKAIEEMLQARGIKTEGSLPAPPAATAYGCRNYYYGQEQVVFSSMAQKFKLSLTGGYPCPR